MTIDPQTMQLLEIFGPIALAAVGTVLTAVFGAMIALGKYAWNRHQARMSMMASALGELAKGIQKHEEYASAEHKKIWETIQGLRAELQLANRNTDNVKVGLLKLEGALENQRATIQDYIKVSEKLGGKMEAIFRFVDKYVESVPRRATDSGG